METDAKGREKIIITEIPFQLNKARLIEKIAELVKEKRIEGISELRDESDKDGLRVVIEVRRGESGEVILNNLYSQTQLQSVFGINCGLGAGTAQTAQFEANAGSVFAASPRSCHAANPVLAASRASAWAYFGRPSRGFGEY